MPRKGKGSKQKESISKWGLDDFRRLSIEEIEYELHKIAPKPKVKIYG